MENNKPNKFVHIAIIAGIVIVINLFLNYASSFVFHEPVYEEYFSRPQIVTEYKTQESCLSVGGQWSENTNYDYEIKTSPKKQEISKGYCDPNYTKQKDFDAKRKLYDRNVFVVLVIAGIILSILGVVLMHPILSPAFSWAGVLSYIVASMRYWGSASSGLRVLILGVALVALIWVALRKYSNTTPIHE